MCGGSISNIISGRRFHQQSKDHSRYDYAALESGGKILESSPHIFGAKGILRDDKDKYLLVPCQISEKWIEISLLEYILIDEIQFIQGEIYSSAFKEIEILYCTYYPSDSWRLLDKITLLPISEPQRFKVTNKWVRFLKIIFKTHYENEHYCTLTQFSVFGSNILQELDDNYYRAKKEEITELLKDVKDNSLQENNLKNIFQRQIEQLNQIELFYEDYQISDENVCLNEFNFNFTCYTEKYTQIDERNNKKIKNTQVDIFQAMVMHMAKTDAYLKLYDNYISFLLELFNNNVLEANNKLANQIHALNITMNDLLYSSSDDIRDMKFWIFYLVFIDFICIIYIFFLKSKPNTSNYNSVSSQCNMNIHRGMSSNFLLTNSRK